jgi:hypothetical protein
VTTPEAIAVLLQPVLQEIPEATAVASLDEAEKALPRRLIEVDAGDAARDAASTGDWAGYRARIDALWPSVQRELRSVPGAVIHYFGTAPIAAAMLVGYRIGTWPNVVARLQHHDRRNWAWTAGGSKPSVTVDGLPDQVVRAEGDVVVRVTTSARIDPATTAEIVPRPLAEIDVRTDPIGRDVLESLDDLEAVARAFRRVLDVVREKLPNALMVHVFAAVPVGLAFRMGTVVSPKMDARVQTYEYDARNDPRYAPALVLQDDDNELPPISDEDKAAAAAMRAEMKADLPALKQLATHTIEHRGAWLSSVLDAEDLGAFAGTWVSLPILADTPIAFSDIDASVTAVPGDFRYRREDRAWEIDDRLLAAISRRLTPENRRMAGRMFLLHEGVHLATHRLSRETSVQVGRLPKVLEAVDYEADVWAMLHEFALARQEPDGVDDVRGFFIRMISAAIDVFWAFDDGRRPLLRMQVRRVNRYLLWYWQLVRLEATSSRAEVFSVLAERPIIELAGLRLVARGERVFQELSTERASHLELGVLYTHALHRLPEGPAMPLRDLLEGFRSRDGARVLTALRAAHDQVRS